MHSNVNKIRKVKNIKYPKIFYKYSTVKKMTMSKRETEKVSIMTRVETE